jgi:hypothetical protein
MFRIEPQHLHKSFQCTISYEIVAEERTVRDVGQQNCNMFSDENILMREKVQEFSQSLHFFLLFNELIFIEILVNI